ncbi:alpha/beta fold hydrolase [Oceanospirillum sediminis]|uniref:Alpha/beta hydrolase n=1 Tax=Oceanospirillum sediminis TaxID=2760088 RepID=A0A839IWW8_9GAMM|nr:alpha/beta hydrolase [Oceanospirillum sediminis]MBB1488949.1 alpha/beta hydrolase [Oceanospirillum sediminis]
MYAQDFNELGFLCSHWPLKPENPTLLLVHGAGLNHAQWQAQMTGLRESANVIAVDLPGHALSAHHDGEQTIAAYADVLAELAEYLMCDNLTLVGHSMGGAVCLEYAVRYPDRLAGLVLLNTGARLKVMPELLDKIRQDFSGFVSDMTRQALTDGADQALMEPFEDLLLQGDMDVVINDFSACNAFDRMDSLNKVCCPSLILCAELDAMTPPKYAQYLSEHLPDSHFELIEGAAHLSPMEHPQEVNQSIRQFVTSI